MRRCCGSCSACKRQRRDAIVVAAEAAEHIHARIARIIEHDREIARQRRREEQVTRWLTFTLVAVMTMAGTYAARLMLW